MDRAVSKALRYLTESRPEAMEAYFNFLRANGSSDDTAKQAAELLKKIESAKYSGLGIDATFKADLLSEIKLFVKDLI